MTRTLESTTPSSSLAGKYALVTGGSRGIGAAIAIQFAKKGAAGVAITYVGNKIAAGKVVAEIESFGSIAIAFQADVVSENVGESIVQKALQGLETNHLDIIVNNAALAEMKYHQPFASITSEMFRDIFQANVLTPMSIIRAALPHLPEKGGRIINISSVASKMANMDPFMTYGASKAALDSFTRSLGQQFAADKHCTFNSLSVGGTETDAMRGAFESFPDEMAEKYKSAFTAEHRWGNTEDIAMIVGFLASEESRWINGANVPANGGSMLALQG